MCNYECEVNSMDYMTFLLFPLKKVWLSILDWPWIKIAFAMLISFVSYVFQENVIGVGVLVGLVCFDQISGVWLALKKGNFSSNGFRNGIVKLLFYLIIIASFHALPKISPTLFSWLSLDTGALAYLSVTEVISIVENSCLIVGIPFPSWLLDKLSLFIRFGTFNDQKYNKRKKQ